MWKNAILILLSFLHGGFCADEAQDDMNKLCIRQGIYTISNPKDCASFIFCKYNVAEKIQCPATQPCFDKNLLVCTAAGTCSCENDAVNDVVKNYCRSKEPDSWFIKVPAEDCSMFYVCMGAGLDPIAIHCPNGWHYSRAEEDCVTPLKAGCQSLTRMCQNQYDGFRFPAIDCSEFYECNAAEENKPKLKTCPTGQYYDGNTYKCIAVEDSNCKNENEQPETPTTTVATPIKPPNCTTLNEGVFYPHEDCNKFYICANNFPVVIYCADGYYYDDYLKLCQKDNDKRCRIN